MATRSYRDKTKVSEDVEKLDHSLFAVGNENGISILETNLAVCLKGKHFIDPEVALMNIYTREMKTYVHTKTCMQIFIAAF